MPRAFAEEWQAGKRVGTEQSATATGAAILDLWEVFCTEDACSTVKDDLPVYKSDGFHLNRAGSELLAPQWREVLAP